MSGVLVRAIDAHDDAEVVRHRAFQAAYGTMRHATVEEFRAFLPSVADTLLLVAEDPIDDSIVGCALAHVDDAFGTGVAMCNLFALPGRVDALRSLIDRIRSWTSIDALRAMYVHASNPSEQARADLEAAGLRFGNDRFRVVRPLTRTDTTIDVPVPDGVRLSSMAEHGALADQFVALWNEAMADVPGTMAMSGIDATGVRRALQIDDDAWPDRIRVAVDEHGSLLGFCALATMSTSDKVEYGHRLTAVTRTARGRGIARALKLDAIRWAAAAGADQLVASNDSDNAPMRAINDRLGYQRQFTVALFELPLDAGGNVVAPT